MKSSYSSTSSNHIFILLIVVIVAGLVASWGIRYYTPQVDVLAAPIALVQREHANEEVASEEIASEANGSTAANPVGRSAAGYSPAADSSLAGSAGAPNGAGAGKIPQPTVLLPRQALVVTPEKLEAECELFIKRLLEQLPEDPHALNLGAMYYSQALQTAQADKLWVKILALKAEDPVVFHNWSTNAIHQGDSERALEILKLAEDRGMRDPQLEYQKAIALGNLGRDEEVLQLLAPRVATQQMSGSLWLQLGLSQIKLGKHAEARDALLEAKKQGISNKPLLNGLITASVRLGDREGAQGYRTELESMEEKITEFGEEQYQTRTTARIRTFSLGILGEGIEVYRLAGRLDDAEHTALRVLAIDPNQLEVYELLNRIYIDRNELANQLAVLERMSELQPGYLLNYLLMAKAAAMMGDHARAESLIKLTISLGPEDPTSWIAMAEYLMEQKRPQQAVWYIQRAQEIGPSPQGAALLELAMKQAEGAPQGEAQAAGSAQPPVSAADRERPFPTVRAMPVGRDP